MDERLLSIGVQEAREKCKNIDNVEQRAKAAMKVMKGHWFVSDEGQQFRAAIAATILETTNEKEKEALARSHRNLAKVSLLMQAAQSNVDIADLNIEEGEALPILAWWQEL